MTFHKIASDADWRPAILIATEADSETVSFAISTGSASTTFSISRAAFAELAAIAATINQETWPDEALYDEAAQQRNDALRKGW